MLNSQRIRFENNRAYSRSIVSSHLSFVDPRPTPLALKIARMKQVKSVPQETELWLNQVLVEEDKVAQATADRINAKRLAVRIAHKFLKWGGWHFYANSRTDFYDGTVSPEGTQPQTLAFSGELREALATLMSQLDIEPDWILGQNRMYLGPTSQERFGAFIKVVPQVASEATNPVEQVDPVAEEAKQDVENIPTPVLTSENVPKFELSAPIEEVVPAPIEEVVSAPIEEVVQAPVPVKVDVVIPDASEVVVPVVAEAPAVSAATDAGWGSWLYSWVASAPVETPTTTPAQV